MIDKKDLKKYTIQKNKSVYDAIKKINSNKKKFIVVLDKKKLFGTLTDGDIRRYFLKKNSLQIEVKNICNKKPYYESNLTKNDIIIKNLKKKKITQCPILNKKNELEDILFLDLVQDLSKYTVLIMAGGLGKRLLPITKKIPKPMIKINGEPMLETVIKNFIYYGFENFLISVNYKSKQIENFFKNGKKWNVSINYLKEKKRLGTGGSLSLIKNKLKYPLIVSNCDIITNLNFFKLLNFYKESNAKALMCVKKYSFKVPYGIIELDKMLIKNIIEKPKNSFFINAGVYIIDQSLIKYVPNKYVHMTEVFEKFKKKGVKINAYPIMESWADAGDFYTLEQLEK